MRAILFLFLFSIINFAVAQRTEVVVPALTSPVMDQASLMGPQDRADLEQIIRQIFEAGGPQITIYTVNDLQGFPIEDFSIKTAEKWQLGSKEKDNGLLIIVAKAEREMRIEVGGGLEGDLTDAESNRYIREILVPAFKQGDFHGGLRELLVQLSQKFQLVTSLESQAPVAVSKVKSPLEKYFVLILIVFVIGNMIMSKFIIGRAVFSGLVFGSAAFFLMATFNLAMLLLMIFVGVMVGLIGVHNLLYAIMAAQGRGGRGGGGFGGGGGWSGGGGGFSGGGSSGRW